MTTVLDQKIASFTDAVKKAIHNENWHAALSIALTLPDICGNLQDPDPKSSTRKKYVTFFNDFLKPKYVRNIGASKEEYEFLNGRDMYALRCSFLHSGTVDITKQSIRDVLDGYIFIEPDKVNGNFIHMNQIDDTLQLQIDAFCLEIIDGVHSWLKSYKENEEIQERAKLMIDILNPSNGIRI